MAYWIDESAPVGSRRQITFLMDTDSDVANLPTSVASGVQQGQDVVSCQPCGKGSRALSIGSGNIFLLNSQDEWIEWI